MTRLELDSHSTVSVKAARLDLTSLMAQAQQLVDEGKCEAAEALYESWLALGTDPLAHIAWFNLGAIRQRSRKFNDAVKAYEQALSLVPQLVVATINLGLCFESLGRNRDALSTWEQIVAGPVPDQKMERSHYLMAVNHKGRVLEELNDLEGARQAFEHSLKVDSNQADVLQHWAHVNQKSYQWPVIRSVGCVSESKVLLAMSPLPTLALSDNPALLLLNAREFTRRKWGFSEVTFSFEHRVSTSRIRIGYVSGDLCMHAVGLLLPEFLRSHDRTKFEVYGYDFSPEDGSGLRQFLKESFDVFRSINQLTDEQAARQIASDGVDILIDLHGLSLGARPGIFARRPSLIQCTYLGFMGTTGAPWIDFVIADREVLPPELSTFFTEEPICVDGCFIPLSFLRLPSNSDVSRDSVGLPEDKVIFAAASSVYKITPSMFSNWVQILKRTNDSILWLIHESDLATKNLRQSAVELGLMPDRIVFTQRCTYSEYANRLALADVFLDTYPYNCGSTGRDIIIAAVPMVTKFGPTMVSRMGKSMLCSMGLEELTVASDHAYVELAVALGQSATKRSTIRGKLLALRTLGASQVTNIVRSLEKALVHRLDARTLGSRHSWV